MSDKTDTSGANSGHVRNASATERLSALLDERGKAHSVWPSGLVVWHDEGSWVYEYSPAKAEGDYWGGILYATLRHCGPEQAVVATLGPGTCKPVISDNLNESEGTGDAWADCSECGHLLFVLTDPNSQPPNYCPGCGRRVEDA